VSTLYECDLRHVRTVPLRHGFRYGTYLWFVDLDDLPRLTGVPVVARIPAGAGAWEVAEFRAAAPTWIL